MAVNPKLLSRVGSYLRGGPTEREESRTDALAAIESDLAGTDDIGVKEDLSSYLLDDIKFGDVDLSTIREITPDEKREAVVSKHEDNDNYEAWSPKGDPWSYELIAAEPASASYIVAKKGDRTIKIRPEDTGFAKVLATSPSAAEAGFDKGAPTNTLQPTRDRLEKAHEEYMAKLPPGPTLGPEEAPEEEIVVTSKSRTMGNPAAEKAREYGEQIYNDQLTPGMSEKQRVMAIKRDMTGGKS